MTRKLTFICTGRYLGIGYLSPSVFGYKFQDRKIKKKLRRQWKNTPHIDQGQASRSHFGVPFRLLHPKKEKGGLEGCRLGLKPSPNES
jgi:hypothetical protein